MSYKAKMVVETKKLFPMGDLYGAFFEDINHAADGGLYAELVRNRSFEFDKIDNATYDNLTAWKHYLGAESKSRLYIEDKEPVSLKNPHYAVLEIESGVAGIVNEGFNTGIPVLKDAKYYFSFWCKTEKLFSDDDVEPITVTIESLDGDIYASKDFTVTSKWVKYECELLSTNTDNSARLALRTSGKGKVCFDLVSLFPQDTYKNRKNGLRKDIATLIADLKPKFLRFPGGCLIHDGALEPDARDSMYRWKNTIGPLEDRAARRNNWGYNQTLGLGYYEYFLFCEDIGTKPLPVLPAAYNPHRHIQAPIDELQPWIDDALDLIEFANGDVDTKWGKVRLDLGHPKPFNMEYLAIGNEELFEPFLERYPYFHNAIKEKYPEIKLISSSGPFADGYDFDLMWDEANKAGADLVDEHYYLSPEWMIKHYRRYDKYDRNGAKVFLGEYATLGNKWKNAIAEAVYMIGFENNVDVMGLTCYAPLLCNNDYVNWKPDMIWYDNHQTLKTVNYHIQKMFMNNQGEYHIPSSLEGGPFRVQTISNISGAFGFESVNESIKFDYIKVNGKEIERDVLYNFNAETKKANTNNSNFIVEEIEKDRPIIKYNTLFSEDFEIEFSFVKSVGNGQLKMFFGMQDDIYYVWEIGGWANDMSSLGKCINGQYSNMNFGSTVTIEENKEYEVKLSVKGREIIAIVNGKTYHNFTEMETVIEPLYHCASVDETNKEIIIKAVNINKESLTTEIIIDSTYELLSPITVIAMQSNDMDLENTFESPDALAPTVSEVEISTNSMSYEFTGESVSVFKIKYH